MAESTTAGSITAEYVFLDGSPFAKIEGNSVYYYHNDHIGTPLKMTDANKLIVWYGEFLPFGETLSITGTITNNLRFPGQYYDSETGNNYNYFRDYKKEIGRYIEADPSGIEEGRNHLYVFVANNTINNIDSQGLAIIRVNPGAFVLYGKYCGKGAKDPSLRSPGIDCIDEACRQHDICFQKADVKIYPPIPPLSGKRKECDKTLCWTVYNCPTKKCDKAGIAKVIIMTVFQCPYIM